MQQDISGNNHKQRYIHPTKHLNEQWIHTITTNNIIQSDLSNPRRKVNMKSQSFEADILLNWHWDSGVKKSLVKKVSF